MKLCRGKETLLSIGINTFIKIKIKKRIFAPLFTILILCSMICYFDSFDSHIEFQSSKNHIEGNAFESCNC